MQYQLEYLYLIKDFNNCSREYEDYLLLFDKVEILLKRKKKSIINFLELNSDYVYYGGATYFTKHSKEIFPILFANKRIVIADPLMKMYQFLKNFEVFKFERIKEIIDHAIQNTIELEKEIIELRIIYINPFDFIKEIKENVFHVAKELTLQFLNKHLKVNYETLNDFISNNNKYSFEELEKKFQNLNQYFVTVNSVIDATLRAKIETNYIDCGVDVEKIKDISAIEHVIDAFIGLFGQAFELKSISLILHVPLYVTRPNVLLYVNNIGCVDENDERYFKETNILFSLFQVLKEYDLVDDNDILLNFFNNGMYYNELYEVLIEKKDYFINKYVEYIENYIKNNNIIVSKIIKEEI